MTTTHQYLVTQNFDRYDLDGFMHKCAELGFKNNSSKKEMRWDWVTEKMGAFWAFVRDDEIISLSGCHPFPDIEDAYRIGYRSVVLPGTDPFKGISRYGYNAIPNRILFQYQIRFCQKIGIDRFILTTNSDRDGHMDMSHRMEIQINKYTNLCKYLGDRKIFNSVQSLWEYDVNVYIDTISKLQPEPYYIIDELKKC